MNYREFLEVDTINEIPAGTMKHFDEGMTELCIVNVS